MVDPATGLPTAADADADADADAQFRNDRSATVEAYQKDTGLRDLSRDWLQQTMQKRYVYNFDWLGRPIIQYPHDMQALQEIIWRTRPDVIIETGVAHGGSLMLSAGLLTLLDYADAVAEGTVLDPQKPGRRVIGVDIEIRPHSRAALEAHAMASRLVLIEGSSIASETVQRVADTVGDAKRVMVCLDSMHTHDHVVAELNAYAPLVTPGCYCIVFDCFVEDMPPGFFPNRPWDVGNSPKTAVHAWLAGRQDFEIDRDMATKLLVTAVPDGFLRRL